MKGDLIAAAATAIGWALIAWGLWLAWPPLALVALGVVLIHRWGG